MREDPVTVAKRSNMESRNNEKLLVISSAKLAKRYREEFLKLCDVAIAEEE